MTAKQGAPSDAAARAFRSERVFLITRGFAGLALFIGFYVFALLTMLALLCLPVAVFYFTGRIHVGALAVCVAGAIGVWMSIAPRADDFETPGPLLLPAQQPRLFAELSRLAAATRQRLPKEVYLTKNVEAWVARRGGYMGIGGRRVMGIGLPVLQALTLPELRAVSAHELGHYYGGDVALFRWTYATQAALLRILDDSSGPVFRWYAWIFFRVTRAISRHQERRADRLAAELAGGAALARALCVLSGADAAFDRYWSQVLRPLFDAGFLPPVAEGFSQFLSRADVGALMQRATEKDRRQQDHGPYDTHPPLGVRLAQLRDLGGDAGESERGSDRAIALLDDLSTLEERLLDIVVAQRRRVFLESIAWKNVATRVCVPRWKRLLRKYSKNIAGTTPSSLAGLDMSGLAQIPAWDTPGEPATQAEVAAWIGLAGVALALEQRGFQAELSAAGLVILARGEDRIDLTETLTHLHDPEGAASWRTLCERTGIADIDFATLGDGAAP